MPIYESPCGLSIFVYLLTLVLKPRNFSYTKTLAFIGEQVYGN